MTKKPLLKTVTGFAQVTEHIIWVATGEPVLDYGPYHGTFVF
ncbi:hypothetical protein OAL01_02460 [Rubripirellula sp.]|nr:hypothetical protein [Rubripirellula sp.]MDC0288287.1 hypothetical protein [Rubripirellula sp.]